jgi:dephospho-CoA kinase
MHLLLLAGSTEAGKSTAGAAFENLGALRIKIRDILLALRTGREVICVGARTRVGFDKQEFLEAVLTRTENAANRVTVIESFIDPILADWLKCRWRDGKCCVVFVDAPLGSRVARLSISATMGTTEARQVVLEKDRAKGLPAKIDAWRKMADEWIDNDDTSDAFLRRVSYVYNLLTH